MQKHQKFLLGAVFVAFACAFRGFDAPVRNPMLYAAPNVWTEEGTLSVLGIARTASFFSMLEHFIGTVITAVLSLGVMRGFRTVPKLLRTFDWRDWGALAFVTIGGSALGLYFFLISMTLGKPVVAVLFQQLQPIITLITAAIVLRERPTWWFGIPLTVAILGVILIAVPDFKNAASGQAWIKPAEGWYAVLADVFSLIAAVLWGASTVFGRWLTKKVHYWDLVFLRYCGGFLFLLVFAACNVTYNKAYGDFLGQGKVLVFGWTNYATGSEHRFAWIWPAIGCVFYCTILTGGIIPLTLYYFGLRMTSAAVAGLCELMFPCVAIFVNWYFLNYSLVGMQIGGAACVLLSVVTISVLSMFKKAVRSQRLPDSNEDEEPSSSAGANDDGGKQPRDEFEIEAELVSIHQVEDLQQP